jgi:hypothetical protein
MPQGTSVSEESAPEVWEVPGADGMSLGTINVDVDGASPGQVMAPGVFFRIGPW